MTFGNLFDKLKSSTKQATDQMKLAGRIAGLKVERTTQKSERERLLKEIGSKTYSIFSKTKELDLATLEEEVINELRHIERIETRIDEIAVEISDLQKELAPGAGKDVVEADDVQDADEEEEDDKPEKHSKKDKKDKKDKE